MHLGTTMKLSSIDIKFCKFAYNYLSCDFLFFCVYFCNVLLLSIFQFCVLYVFTMRLHVMQRTVLLSKFCRSVRPSVRPTVCLSVRPSDPCIVTKLNDGLRIF